MKIGIDGNEANVAKRVGSNIYSYEILKEFSKQSNNFYEVYLREKLSLDLPKQTSNWHYKIIKPRFLWTQWRLPMQLYIDRPDIFFTPGHYAPRFCPCPYAISIMDLAFLRYPQQFRKRDLYQLKNWTEYSVKNASHIFTISQFCKKEIINFYNVPENKITVTYPGINRTNKIIKSRNNNKYFIYIGTIQPRKNLKNLIEAVLLLNVNLLIVGKKGWLYDDIFSLIKKHENNVKYLGYIKDEEKYRLLNKATALVLPSFYEGFGIPVLEAMSVGCPVVISKNSSLPEVGGDSAVYINNPNDPKSIQKSLEKVLKLSISQRQKMINDNLMQSKKFSWEKCAAKTLEVLCSL